MAQKILSFWSEPQSDILKELKTTQEGLNEEEAEERGIEYGLNALKPRKRKSHFFMFLMQFKSPIIILLLITSILAFILQDSLDAIIIIVILFISTTLGFWQENKATDAIEKLLSIVHIKSTVLRNGEKKEILVENIVPGDIVFLSAGDIIPADCLILEAKDLFISEATLTGESFSVEKKTDLSKADALISKRYNALFMGTHVISGSSKAVVIFTGKKTEFGKISERLELKPPATEFEHGLKKFGFLLSQITMILVFVIFAVNIYFGRPFLESFLFSLALAIGLTPELLPAIISINLAQGAKRLADQKVIVKKLSSIENFGSMNVLCSDKTGTLTEGTMQLHSIVDIDGKPNDKARLFAYMNSYYESGYINPIDEALRTHAKSDITGYSKLDEIPYDFIRKRLSILVSQEKGNLLISKGAVSNLLSVCTSVEISEGKIENIKDYLTQIQNYYQELSDKGYRILGIAYKNIGSNTIISYESEADLVLLGFIILYDPIKPNITKTIKELNGLGVTLKMITGDNKFVARYVGQEIGLANLNVITGSEIREMSDEALIIAGHQTDIFAEIEPNQKERIILSLKKAGNVVGYIGDGVNDATALHAADVGISVDSGVDVAKDAADIVLLEKDLNVLIEGVKEGRRTFANTIKYIFISTSANFGNMFSMAGASFFLPFLPMLPKQILIADLESDLPALTMGTDNVDHELIERPRRWNIKFIRQFMLVFGIVSSAFDFLTFAILLIVFKATPALFQTGWFFVTVITELLILLVIRTQKVFFKSKPSRYLIIAVAIVAGVTFALIYLPLLVVTGLVSLPLNIILTLIGVVALYITVNEIVKHYFYKKIQF